jgi:hypothetical protein
MKDLWNLVEQRHGEVLCKPSLEEESQSPKKKIRPVNAQGRFRWKFLGKCILQCFTDVMVTARIGTYSSLRLVVTTTENLRQTTAGHTA